jgi:predicted RNase H-like HicB family nuclease
MTFCTRTWNSKVFHGFPDLGFRRGDAGKPLIEQPLRVEARVLTMSHSYGNLSESPGSMDGGTMKLNVILEQDEEGYFVAEVPALLGCLSQGKTREEALANVREAIEGWLVVMESKRTPDPERAVAVFV